VWPPDYPTSFVRLVAVHAAARSRNWWPTDSRSGHEESRDLRHSTTALKSARGTKRASADFVALILVVDDDASTRAAITDVLRANDYDVAAVDRATTGLQLLSDLPVNLVLLDLRLPDTTGEDFLARRRAEGLEAKAPVVVISAAGTVEAAAHVRRLGAALTITKPFNLAELVSVANRFAVAPSPTPK
jgi:CheY-like chemotaxis protein